jgi:hypothetical protein
MKNWSSVFLGVCVLGAAVVVSFKSPEPVFSQVEPLLPKNTLERIDNAIRQQKGGALVLEPVAPAPAGAPQILANPGRYQMSAFPVRNAMSGPMPPTTEKSSPIPYDDICIVVCDTVTGQTWRSQGGARWIDLGIPGAPKAVKAKKDDEKSQ